MPTQLAYRQELGYELNDLSWYYAASGSGSSVALSGVISADGHASTSSFNDAWVFNETQAIQRRARTNGLTPSTGSLTIDPTWTAPNSNDRIEITRLFPCIEAVRGVDTSYRTLINRAIQMLVVPDRISVAIVPGQQAYSLASWQKWLDRESRFGWPQPNLPDGRPQAPVRMLEPGPTGGIPIPGDWRRPHLRLDADVPYLEIEAPFAAGTTGTITLNVMRPANTWVLLGGVWGESVNDGLANDTDEARPSVNDVVTVAKLLAFETLAARGVSSATGSWADRIKDQRAMAEGLLYFDRTAIVSAPAQGAAA